MNLQEIQDSIQRLLRSEEGRSKVEGRRKVIAILAGALTENVSALPRLRSRKAWFSTTQGDATDADNKIRVQLLGVEIAHLSLDISIPQKPCYMFHPKPSVVREVLRDRVTTDVGPWLWSHDKNHAAAINQFLRACEKYPGAKPDNEREIQWQLAKALESDKSGELRDLQPVTWNGLFTEIGVSINGKGALGKKPGNIDLIVRRGKIPKRTGFLVFELKKPGKTDIEAALSQALHYAFALDIEANGGSETDLENFRAVFGAKKVGEKLKIGAVAVLEDDDAGEVRRKALERLPHLWATCRDSTVDRIGVLLYKFDQKERKAKSWKWLPGWDARVVRPVTSQPDAG